jgi:hypothetical protein
MTAGKESGTGPGTGRGRRGGDPTGRAPGGAGTDAGPDRVEPVAIPKWLPAVVFAAVTVVLFRSFLFTDLLLYGSDTFAMGYMARIFFAEQLAQGVFPLWNPLLLGGTPFLDSLAGGDSLYPPSVLLLWLLDPARSLGWKLVLHVFVAGLAMYGWCRAVGRSRMASMVAGIGFMAAPYLVTLVYPGHDGKLFVTALTPLVFWSAERCLTGRGLLPFSALAASVALVILTTHFQMAYFLFGAVGVYTIARAIQEARRGPVPDASGSAGTPARRARPGLRFSGFLLASVLGAGAAAIQFIPAVSYITEFSRRTTTTTAAESPEAARAYASSWSLHPEDMVATLVVPEFIGSSVGGADWTSGTYRGRNPFKLNHEYVGLGLLLLALLSFSGGARPGVRWTLAGIAVVALGFTLGSHSPIWALLYAVLPGVELFRAPSMVIFLTGFAVATLAAFGVDRGVVLARGADDGAWQRGFRLLLTGGGVAVLVAMLAATGALDSVFPAPQGREMALQTLSPYIVRGSLVAVAIAATICGAFWALRSGYLGPAGLAAVLGVLVAGDAIRVADPFIQTADPRELTVPDPNIQFLLGQQQAWGSEPFRVLSLIGAGQDVVPAQFGLEQAAGHHPNDLARYRALIGMEGSGFPENIWSPETGAFNPNVLQLVNAAFLIWPDAQFGPIQGPEAVSRFTLPDGRVVSSVYPLPTLPRAHLVTDVLVLEEGEQVPTLVSEAFDPATQVVLAEPAPVALDGVPAEGDVTWEERTANHLRLQVVSDRAALLVLSENWYPGWKAFVDGGEVPVLRANHTFRAIPIPAGDSAVEFRYESNMLRLSLLVSLFSILLISVPLVMGVVERRRRRSA